MGHLLTVLNKRKFIVQDGFNRPDNAASMGNANTGQTWQSSLGLIGISGGQAYPVNFDSNFNNALSYIPSGISNGKISAKIMFNSNEGIAIRVSDGSNYIIARFNTSGLSLFKIDTGAATTLGNYSFSPVVGTNYTLSLVLSGPSITVYVDGVQRVTASDPFNQAISNHGIRFTVPSAGRIDNFVVEALT